MRPATSSAASTSSDSNRNQPPKTSLVSANGPSVVRTSPPSRRTVVAVSTGRSCAPPTTRGSFAISMYSAVTALRSSSPSGS